MGGCALVAAVAAAVTDATALALVNSAAHVAVVRLDDEAAPTAAGVLLVAIGRHARVDGPAVDHAPILGRHEVHGDLLLPIVTHGTAAVLRLVELHIVRVPLLGVEVVETDDVLGARGRGLGRGVALPEHTPHGDTRSHAHRREGSGHGLGPGIRDFLGGPDHPARKTSRARLEGALHVFGVREGVARGKRREGDVGSSQDRGHLLGRDHHELPILTHHAEPGLTSAVHRDDQEIGPHVDQHGQVGDRKSRHHLDDGLHGLDADLFETGSPEDEAVADLLLFMLEA